MQHQDSDTLLVNKTDLIKNWHTSIFIHMKGFHLLHLPCNTVFLPCSVYILRHRITLQVYQKPPSRAYYCSSVLWTVHCWMRDLSNRLPWLGLETRLWLLLPLKESSGGDLFGMKFKQQEENLWEVCIQSAVLHYWLKRQIQAVFCMNSSNKHICWSRLFSCSLLCWLVFSQILYVLPKPVVFVIKHDIQSLPAILQQYLGEVTLYSNINSVLYFLIICFWCQSSTFFRQLWKFPFVISFNSAVSIILKSESFNNHKALRKNLLVLSH